MFALLMELFGYPFNKHIAIAWNTSDTCRPFPPAESAFTALTDSVQERISRLPSSPGQQQRQGEKKETRNPSSHFALEVVNHTQNLTSIMDAGSPSDGSGRTPDQRHGLCGLNSGQTGVQEVRKDLRNSCQRMCK
jgi:hypothetical protein